MPNLTTHCGSAKPQCALSHAVLHELSTTQACSALAYSTLRTLSAYSSMTFAANYKYAYTALLLTLY